MADEALYVAKENGENFKPELERMAEVNEWTLQQTHDNLKDYYDGEVWQGQ